MESIGDKLKTARNAKKLSIRDVVKHTNINPVYLKALEEEEFDKFPSETYLIGFLRSYSQYLKLDAEDIIQAYRGYKIGESATPLEELTKPTKPSIAMIFASFGDKFKNVAFFLIIVVSALAVYWGIRTVMSSKVDVWESNSIDKIKSEYTEKNKGTKFDNIKTLQLNNNKGFILVYKNEGVQFLVDNKEVFFQLKDIKDNSIIIEFIPGNQSETIEMDKPKKINVKDCPRELTLTLKGLTENRAKIFVRLEKRAGAVSEKIAEDFDKKEVENINVVAVNKKNLKIVFEAIFEHKSFIEIYLDGSMKKRGFFSKGSVERWEAAEYIQIKVGNAGGLRVKINGKEYKFGKLGQVANKVIKWKRDVKNPNLYHIVVNDW